MNKSVFVGMVIGALSISLAASILGTSNVQMVNAQNATEQAQNATEQTENVTSGQVSGIGGERQMPGTSGGEQIQNPRLGPFPQ
jgi:hypothetical protein